MAMMAQCEMVFFCQIFDLHQPPSKQRPRKATTLHVCIDKEKHKGRCTSFHGGNGVYVQTKHVRRAMRTIHTQTHTRTQRLVVDKHTPWSSMVKVCVVYVYIFSRYILCMCFSISKHNHHHVQPTTHTQCMQLQQVGCTPPYTLLYTLVYHMLFWFFFFPNHPGYLLSKSSFSLLVFQLFILLFTCFPGHPLPHPLH